MYKQGTDRNQTILFPPTLEELIEENNPVRVIDAFVDSLELKQLGFSKTNLSSTGCNPYNPVMLLKLYIYGYMNRIRSSRKLERECTRNIELMWLTGKQTPKYHTISDFRKGHSRPIRMVFRQFVVLCSNWDLLGKELIAIDGSKFRAVNSKKNNYNQKKIERHLAYIDNKIKEYLEEMEENDRKEKGDKQALKVTGVKEKIKELKKRREKYEYFEKQLEESKEGQISTTDKDSRGLITHRDIVEVSYNAQTSVDAKHNLLVHYKSTNQNDRKVLGTMAIESKQALEVEELEVLADKGYHNGEELAKCKKENITTYVSPQEYKHNNEIPTKAYYREQFEYDEQKDIYTCPEGNNLKSNGRWYKRRGIRIKQYKTKVCGTCKVNHLCTSSIHGRVVERHYYQKEVEENNKRVKENKEKYLRRQAIVEHPFGTIKRQWGYNHLLLKGLEKTDGELGLIFLCYNIKRVMNIFGIKGLISKLSTCFNKLTEILGILSSFIFINYFINRNLFFKKKAFNSLYLPNNY